MSSSEDEDMNITSSLPTPLTTPPSHHHPHCSTKRTFTGPAGANTFFRTFTLHGDNDNDTRRASRIASIAHTTHLTLVLSGADWTDEQDDTWAIALSSYGPHSAALRHLTLHVTGNVLFTAHNYVKPIVINAVLSITTTTSNAHSGPTTTCASIRSTNRADTSIAPKKYTFRPLPPSTLPAHVYPKAIIPALLSLTQHRHLETVSIQGPMEMSLRMRILSSLLGPHWRENPLNAAQAGLVPSLAPQAAAALDAERHFQKGLISNLTNAATARAQCDEDFGAGVSVGMRERRDEREREVETARLAVAGRNAGRKGRACTRGAAGPSITDAAAGAGADGEGIEVDAIEAGIPQPRRGSGKDGYFETPWLGWKIPTTPAARTVWGWKVAQLKKGSVWMGPSGSDTVAGTGARIGFGRVAVVNRDGDGERADAVSGAAQSILDRSEPDSTLCDGGDDADEGEDFDDSMDEDWVG